VWLQEIADDLQTAPEQFQGLAGAQEQVPIDAPEKGRFLQLEIADFLTNS
jgi:hypothetical protein